LLKRGGGGRTPHYYSVEWGKGGGKGEKKAPLLTLGGGSNEKLQFFYRGEKEGKGRCILLSPVEKGRADVQRYLPGGEERKGRRKITSEYYETREKKKEKGGGGGLCLSQGKGVE